MSDLSTISQTATLCPVQDMSVKDHIRICQRCGTHYDFSKQQDLHVLKLTWCSSMCQAADLNFDLVAFERSPRRERHKEEEIAL